MVWKRFLRGLCLPERRELIRVHAAPKIDIDFVVPTYYYSTFAEVCSRVSKCKLDNWTVDERERELRISNFCHPFIVPKYQLIICIELEFTIAVYGWLLPDTHDIYSKYRRSIRNVTVSNILKEIEAFVVCDGITERPDVVEHVIPQEIDLDIDGVQCSYYQKIYRSKDCFVLNDLPSCTNCDLLPLTKEKRKKSEQTAIHINAPITTASHARLVATVKEQRKDLLELKKKLEIEFGKKGVTVDQHLAQDIDGIMDSNQNITPFMRLFWNEQKQYSITNGTVNRYHPMIIRFFLSLVLKSAI